MTTALKAVWFAGGAAFCFLCWQTSLTVAHIRQQVPFIAGDIHRIAAAIDANALAGLETQAEFRNTLQTIAAETQALRGAVETQTAYALIILNNHLEQANSTFYKAGYSVSSSAAAIADNVDGVAAGAKQIESQVSDLISSEIKDEFLDCEGLGASCLQNNVFSTLGAVRRSAEAIEREMPRITENVAKASEDAAAITGTVRRNWWKPWKWF